jgi:hypothetical protein
LCVETKLCVTYTSSTRKCIHHASRASMALESVSYAVHVCMLAHEYSVRAQSFMWGLACVCVCTYFNKCMHNFVLVSPCMHVECVRAWTSNVLAVFCFLRFCTRTRRMITVIAARWCMFVRMCVHRCMYHMYEHSYVNTAIPSRQCIYLGVWVHEQGEHSARWCMYECMCVGRNKECADTKWCMYARVCVWVK